MRGVASVSPSHTPLRAVLLAGVGVLSGTALHTAAGGHAPATLSLLGLWALASFGASALLDRRPTDRRVLATVLGSQALVHVVAALGGGHHAGLTTPAGAHHGHVAHTTVAASNTAGPSAQLMMVGAHLAASALVCWWMARGEHALWVLLEIGARPLREAWSRCAAVASPLTPSAVRTGRPASTRTASLLTRVLDARAVTRRGPPRGIAQSTGPLLHEAVLRLS